MVQHCSQLMLTTAVRWRSRSREMWAFCWWYVCTGCAPLMENIRSLREEFSVSSLPPRFPRFLPGRSFRRWEWDFSGEKKKYDISQYHDLVLCKETTLERDPSVVNAFNCEMEKWREKMFTILNKNKERDIQILWFTSK